VVVETAVDASGATGALFSFDIAVLRFEDDLLVIFSLLQLDSLCSSSFEYVCGVIFRV